MNRKLLLPLLIVSLTLTACSLFAPRPSRTTPAQQATQDVPFPIQPEATATGRPLPTEPAPGAQAPTAAAPTSTARPTPTEAQVTPTARPTRVSQPGEPVAIVGEFTYTNDIITTYYVEHMVALVDMYGFVTRDQEWEIPIASQTLGYMEIDEEAKRGTFNLQLPARPTSVQADVDQDAQQEPGVQVFSVAYFPNLAGGPYSGAEDPSKGWPAYLTSAKTDSENKDEITGGRLVIWAPDDAQSFPSDFGADGLLFTEDDPVMDVPAGYSVVDLDQPPFQLIHEVEAEVTLYEPADAAVKDFADLSYTEAFDSMFEIVRKEYAFNGIEDKAPDWDTLYAELAPQVQAAEEQSDPVAFYRAMRAFVTAFQDGHVGLNGGEVEQEIVGEQIGGGYGFAIRELEDGRVISVFVLDGGPADEAGMDVGAEISEFNGKPIGEAIGEVQPPTAPHSTDFALRYQQAIFLLRAPVGTQASVTFTNQGRTAETVDLEAVEERETLGVTSPMRGFDPTALPVEHIVAAGGIGYVRVNSNYDDLNLIVRLFQRALETFEENGVEALIIDMRQNSGGAPLSLAGFLTDEEIPLGQLQYYSDNTGQFEPDGPPDVVTPQVEQFRFDKLFLLVDQACASACEIEAYGFSQVPGMVVIGQYPTSGTEAEVARGQFELPEGMSLQVPTGRFILPDGSIFLEGQGVEPTERVPITEQTVLSDGDPVIQRALELARQ